MSHLGGKAPTPKPKQLWSSNNFGEVREKLYNQSLKWTSELNQSKSLKQIGTAAKEALDEVAGAADLAIYAVAHLDGVVKNHEEGIKLSNNLAQEVKKLADDNAKGGKDLAKQVDRLSTDIHKRCSKNATHIQQIQLARSEHTIIIRGIPRAIQDNTRRETYGELEKAVITALTEIGCPAIRFKSIRRMQASSVSTTRNQPPSLRVELASQGDKFTLFQAVERYTKDKTKLPFSLTHEIPKYALSSYKYCQAVAAIIREENPTFKTRVLIPRGETWPVVMWKAGPDQQYKPIGVDWFNSAKEQLIARNREKAAARKAARLRDGRATNRMDVGN